MEKLALTGGIGTGKTFISKMFIEQGIPVFYADEEAKKLYGDPVVLAEIRAAFGESVFPDGRPDFKKIAELVFDDHAALKKLENIIHPRVMAAFEQWASEQSAEKVMMESAIIFEGGLEKYFDKIIVVNASLPVRMERIRRRNPELSDQEILARIHRQMPQEKKCALADEIIEHDVDL
ncbi:MAG: dephospho-CoA kinase [Bacteroidales bacterium]|nr:dephospho-CoA kinase [Bacteroidales bacterium]